MIIVLDTNVLVSVLLKADSSAGAIVRLVAKGSLRLAYDARVLIEYREVLSRPKFGLKKKEVDVLLLQIEEEGELVTAAPLEGDLPDPDDKPFLELALAISSRVLVTGNKKHFPAEICKHVLVMSPSEFVPFHLKHSKKDDNF